MGHENRGMAGLVVDFAQPAAQFLAHLRIQCTKRLIQQKHTRFDRHGAGQRHALALAAGKLRRIAFFQPAQLHEIKKLQRTAANFRRGWARPTGANLQPETDIIRHRHMAEQRIMLEDKTDITLLHALLRGIFIPEEDHAFGWRFQPRNQAQKRGLARTRWSKQGNQFAGLDGQRHIMQGRKASKLLTHAGNTNFHSQSFPLPPARPCLFHCAAITAAPEREHRCSRKFNARFRCLPVRRHSAIPARP